MNKIRAQLRAHKIVTAVMGFLLIASFAIVGVRAITMTPSELKEFLPQEETLGAVSGPELFFPSWTVNGVEQFQERKPMQIATSTTCWFAKPVATSTLDFFSAIIASSTGEAVSWTLATSTTQYATSTAFALAPKFTVAASDKGHFVWTPNVLGTGDVKQSATPETSTIEQINAFVLTPSDYIILRSGYSAASGHDLGGSCQVRYTEL